MRQAPRGVSKSGGRRGVLGWSGPARGEEGLWGQGRGFSSVWAPAMGEPAPGCAKHEGAVCQAWGPEGAWAVRGGWPESAQGWRAGLLGPGAPLPSLSKTDHQVFLPPGLPSRPGNPSPRNRCLPVQHSPGPTWCQPPWLVPTS